jgi:ABC-2 type transport system permease protein
METPMDKAVVDLPRETSRARIPQPRSYSAVNWVGLWTLCKRETRRWLKVGMQTLFAPVVSAVLMLLVFKLAYGGADAAAFEAFLAPGVVMMAILNNAFANSSSSILNAKVMGNSVDFLMPPLSPGELTVGFLSGAVSRGVVVGVITFVSIWVMGIAPFSLMHPLAMLYYALVAGLLMGALGILGGVWAEKFDHMAAVTNFIIMPLTMLSGTFYSVSRLSEPFETISHFNPFFHLIDGFRYAFIGKAESDLGLGALYVGAMALALCVAAWLVLRSGWKLKA